MEDQKADIHRLLLTKFRQKDDAGIQDLFRNVNAFKQSLQNDPQFSCLSSVPFHGLRDCFALLVLRSTTRTISGKLQNLSVFLLQNIYIVDNVSSCWTIQLDFPCTLGRVRVLVNFICHSIFPFLLIQQAFRKMVFLCVLNGDQQYNFIKTKTKCSNGVSGSRPFSFFNYLEI